jgi:hypothetical protein
MGCGSDILTKKIKDGYMQKYRVDFIITKYVEAKNFDDAETIARNQIKKGDREAIFEYSEEIRVTKI